MSRRKEKLCVFTERKLLAHLFQNKLPEKGKLNRQTPQLSTNASRIASVKSGCVTKRMVCFPKAEILMFFSAIFFFSKASTDDFFFKIKYNYVGINRRIEVKDELIWKISGEFKRLLSLYSILTKLVIFETEPLVDLIK